MVSGRGSWEDGVMAKARDTGPVVDLRMTQSFAVSAFLVMAEGEARSIALLISMLYGDPALRHDAWSVSHAHKTRKELVAALQAQGATHLRVGISAENEATVDIIRRRAEALRVRVNAMRTRGNDR
jgi:hypothetical protein